MRIKPLVAGIVIVLIWGPACGRPSGSHGPASSAAPSYPKAKVLRGLRSAQATEQRDAIDRLMRDGAKARALVVELIPLLADRDWQVAKNATAALGAIGPAAGPAVPALIQAFKRRKQAKGLPKSRHTASQQPPPRGPSGPEHLRDRSHMEVAMWAVRRIGKPCVAPLVKALQDRIIRPWATHALRELGRAAHGAGPALLELLDQELTSGVTEKVQPPMLIRALRETGNARLAVTTILRRLVHSDANVRARAAWACDRLCTSPDIPALLHALADSDTRVRGYAVDALGRFPKQSAQIVPALAKALPQSAAGVRTRIMRAFGQLAFNATPKPERLQVAQLVRPSLVKGLRDRNAETRAFALHGLGNLGPLAAPAVRQIIRALKDPKWVVQAAAAQAMGSMGSAAKPGVAALINALGSRTQIGSKGEDPHVVSVAAMRALSRLGAVALPEVVRALRHGNQRVTLYAVRCLASMRPKPRTAVGALKQLRRRARGKLRTEVDTALARISKTP